MGLPRAFVGFSSSDIGYYQLMRAWKANSRIPFDFCDCQLRKELRSGNENYIKSKCRERLRMAGTFIQLIGQDTRRKHKYVRWEAEVALEKGCRIIAVNIDGWRRINIETCPPILRGKGVLFVPYSPMIVAYAIENWEKMDVGNWEYPDETFRSLGYSLHGNIAKVTSPLDGVMRGFNI
ncbi:MAG: TIR domain-containing protein [Rhodocyclaceae bacterium]|nr:TIR domain-containing protein [Rhodocyclaceae bacterium]